MFTVHTFVIQNSKFIDNNEINSELLKTIVQV